MGLFDDVNLGELIGEGLGIARDVLLAREMNERAGGGGGQPPRGGLPFTGVSDPGITNVGELSLRIAGGNGGAVATTGGLFAAPSGALRPKSVVAVPDPVTGEVRFFGHLGRPLLFSRDVAAARKVSRLARRFARRRTVTRAVARRR